VKGEIADEQNGTADVKQASVHLSGVIREDSQIYKLFGNEFGIFDGVLFADTEVNEQSFIDSANCLANHFNLCLQNSLYNDSHLCP
jgi:hypothetical protein